MEWNALIRIFDGESALYGMVTDKKVKYKNEEQNWEDSARINVNLLDLDEAVALWFLLYWCRLQKSNKFHMYLLNTYFY